MKWVVLLIISIHLKLFAQEEKRVLRTVAFYNVENLFDTIDDPEVYDEDFTPKGKNRYTSEDYRRKILSLAELFPKISSGTGRTGPHLLGLAEVENRRVLEDLIYVPGLDSLSYDIVHVDSPDRRGIDVALLYRKDFFFPISHRATEVRLWDESGQRIHTRDVLWVHGIMDGEELHVLVNHWPSRRGGRGRSAPKRMKAALANRDIISEILSQSEQAKILIMGDFNDDPTDDSLTVGLNGRSYSNLEPGSFYNPMIRMHERGFNTLVYRDRTNLFDQILLSYSLIHPEDEKGFRLRRASIYSPGELITREGKYRGYPRRSFENGKYNGGYSDHYPVYVELIK